MNNKAKALLIPIAAFAVTVTGASAFNSDVLERAGLDDDKISAFEQAHELRDKGDRDGARNILMEAGIDIDTMKSVREAMHEHHEAMRTAIDEAVEDGDYDAFKEAIQGSPLEDIVTSEDDFNQFSEAHQLREEGDREAAREIMEDLGFPERGHRHDGKHLGHDEGERGEGQERGGHFGGFRGGENE